MPALLDDLAIVQIFVHDALGRPVEGIAEQSGGMLRQRADPHADGAAALELAGEIGADDADEARRQAALRGHDALGAVR